MTKQGKRIKWDECTDEQRAHAKRIVDEWIGIALSTGRMTDDERATVDREVRALYKAGGCEEPKVVVVVPSPLVMALAGVQAGVWWAGQDVATDAATSRATQAATHSATDAATQAATQAATHSATDEATQAATDAATARATRAATELATDAATARATARATRAATELATARATRAATVRATELATELAAARATRAATDVATYAATYAATDAATDAATELATARATVRATDYKNWWRPYQGGNMWAWSCAYVAATRDALGLNLPEHEAFKPWEALARVSGFRYMHKDFCLVSEKPIKLETELVGNRHVPHCEDGPSHLWADGFAIWHWHGVAVPREVIEAPETITIESIKAERNAEVRRIMRERYGDGRYLSETGAIVIDVDTVPSDLLAANSPSISRALLEDDEGNKWLVGSDGSTGRVYHMQVEDTCSTCAEAYNYLSGREGVRTVIEA